MKHTPLKNGLIGRALLCIFALSLTSVASATEMILRLTDVTPSASMAGVRSPAVLFLAFDGTTLTDGYVMVPHDVADGNYRGNGAVFPLSSNSLSLNGGVLSGSVSANVQAAGSGSTTNFNVTLNATENSGSVSGTYTGTFGGNALAGDLSGSAMVESPSTTDTVAGVYLYKGEPRTPSGGFEFGPFPIYLSYQFAGGILVSYEAHSGNLDAGPYNAEVPKVYRVIGPRGDFENVTTKNASISSRQNASAFLSGDTFNASIELTFLDDQIAGRVFTYELNGHVIGNALMGSYTVSENGGVIFSSSFQGFLGDGLPVPAETLPTLSPLHPAADNENSGFRPPYFAQLTPSEIRERLFAATLWLTDAPEVNAFAIDAATAGLTSNGDKQYDNAAFNAYGGAVAFGILSELTDDPGLQRHALEAAERAGHWIDTDGRGGYAGLAGYYKQMFFISVWGALAHMDLYETTGEARWLEAVKGYMDFLQNEVTNRMAYPSVRDFAPDDGVAPGRTWTFLNDQDGSVGESNQRYDRSSDNQEVHPAEFLWLLGKLRVDHGVTDYQTFEANAYQWVQDNIDDAFIWNYRPDGQPATPQAIGPTMYALYLLDYAPSYDPTHLQKVVDHVEQTLIDWSHPVSDDSSANRFFPSVRDYYPRWSSGYLATFVPGTAATSRMALVYLKRYEATGNPTDLAKARALAHSVLNRQKLSNGMIDNLGIPAFSEDHETRLYLGPNGTPPDVFGNPNGRIDSHPYTALKANALRNLLEYVELEEALGIGCSQAQEITVTPIIDKLPGDAPFALNATSSSGLPVSYELVYGPASLAGNTITLDGSTGIVKVIASQAGNSTWCEAASETIFISVGNQVPPSPSNVAAFGTDTTTIEVSWTDISTNEVRFRIEQRELGESDWEIAGFVGANVTSRAVGGLQGGVTYEFQVIALNQVAESAPAGPASASPLEDAVFIFLELECGEIGTGFRLDPNAAAGGGVELFATVDQRRRDEIDPASIIEYEFYVPVSATYSLWLRGYTTTGGSSDSIWLMVDDGIHIGDGSPTFYGQAIFNQGFYGWQANNDAFFLEEGLHKVTIAPREDNGVIDRIMLTTSTDFFTSFGIGGDPVNCPVNLVPVSIIYADDEVDVSFYGEARKTYQIQISTSAHPQDWFDDGAPINGNDETFTFKRDTSLERLFIRVIEL